MQRVVLWSLTLPPGLPAGGAEGGPTACRGTGPYSPSLAAAGCHMRAQPLARKARWDLRARWGGAGPSAAGNHGLRLEPRPPTAAAGRAQVAPSPVPTVGIPTGRESQPHKTRAALDTPKTLSVALRGHLQTRVPRSPVKDPSRAEAHCCGHS